MTLPPDHPSRREVNDEVHARPTAEMAAPLRISYLALTTDDPPREAGYRATRDLVTRFGARPPPPGANHHTADLGAFRLQWESHTEYNRFTIVAPGGRQPFAAPALGAVPEDWVAGLPGQTIVAAHVALVPAVEATLDSQDVAQLFGGNVLVGADVADGAATATTDFRIHGDGFSRFLLVDRTMSPRQAGRMVQRLLEIDTYRMLALLALGPARGLVPFLSQRETELARITAALVEAREADEPLLLERLTRMEAEIESREAETLYRFAASRAYDDLVRRRITELREVRIEGLQTFREFTERRLAPAMDTCRSVASRQEALSQRVARATQLLSTRIDVTREQQTVAVLESMNRRAQIQLRLQSTVEGLSVAAVTYYVIGLVGYLAKGLKAGGVKLEPEVAVAAALPIVAFAVYWGLRRARRALPHE